MIEYLKIEELKDGYLYVILARNANYGIWKKETNSFFISRWKFGNNYIFEEHHWDTDMFPTARPAREIEKSPFSLWEEMGLVLINKGGRKHWTYTLEEEMLEYLNKWERKCLDA